MLAFISRRLILAFFTIWVVSVLAFAVIQLPPGDMVDQYIDALMEGSYFIGNIGANPAPLQETQKEARDFCRPEAQFAQCLHHHGRRATSRPHLHTLSLGQNTSGARLSLSLGSTCP